MHHATIEQLESRRLLSGGLTAVGSPITIATIPGQYVPKASCAIGSGTDVFLAYIDNKNVVQGLILDGTTGSVVVPTFQISTNGQSADAFRPIAAVQDSNGNAVLAYGVSNNPGDNLFIARIGATGQVVLPPTKVTGSTDDQSAPALAIDTTNNSVAIAFVDEVSVTTNTTTIFASVLDANDIPVFSAVQISVPSTSPFQYLSTPTIIFESNGNFLAAWNRIDFNSSNIDTFVSIDDRSFSPTGVLGIDPTLFPQTPSATSNNNVSPSVAVTNPDGTQTITSTVEQFDAAGTYLGTTFRTVIISANGTITKTSTFEKSFANPFEEIAVQGFNVTNGTTNYIQYLSESGTNGSSGEVTATVNGFAVDENGNIVFADTPIFSAAGANDVSYANGLISYFTTNATNNTTALWFQEVKTDTPVLVPPPLFTVIPNPTSVTAPDGSSSVTFLFDPPSDFSTNFPTGYDLTIETDPTAGTAVSGVDYTAETTTVNVPANQTGSVPFKVPAFPSATDKTLGIKLVDPASGDTIVAGTGTITGTTDMAVQPVVSIGTGVYKPNKFGFNAEEYTLTLNTAPTTAVTVKVTVAATAANAAQTFDDITFAAGQTSVNVEVSVNNKPPAGTVITAVIASADGATIGTGTATGTIPANANMMSPIDLTVHEESVPADVVPGLKTKITFKVDATDTGPAVKGDTSTVGLYATIGTSANDNPVLIASKNVKFSLKTGKSKPVSFNITKAPADLTDGINYLLVLVTDSTGATNVTTTTQTFNVAAAFIQPAVSVGAVIPATIPSGKTGSVLVTVTNNGNVPASGVALMLSPSTDGATPVAGVILETIHSGAKIQPGKSKTYKLHFKATTAGTFFPYISVTLGGVSTTEAGTTSFTVG